MDRLRRLMSFPFAAGFLSCLMLLVSLLMLYRAQYTRTVMEQRASGLGAVAGAYYGEDSAVGWEPTSLWRQSTLGNLAWGRRDGIAESHGPMLSRAAYRHPMADRPEESGAVERKIVRTAHLRLVVKDPSQALEAITALARQFSGYAASSQIQGWDEDRSASVTIRIPAERFDEARVALRGLAVRVDDETIEASDVTKQFFDYQATLANYRAEEAQYLEILKRATAVKDVLAVSQQLAEVRGRIHTTEGESRYLSQQIAMASIEVALRTETEAQVAGLHWRPLFVLRQAARDGVDGLADYAAAMLALLLRLPAIVLWVATVLFLAKYAWKLLRWWWKAIEVRPAPPTPAS